MIHTMEHFNYIYLILFLVCLGFAAFFCSAETAFIGMQKMRLQHLLQTSHPRAKTVARIMEQPEKFLATVLLAINFFETAVATLGTLMAISLWGEDLGAAIATIIITILTLIFAELIPKSLASRYGESIALVLAEPIRLTGLVLYPFVFILNHIGLRFTRLGNGDPDSKPTISQEEIHAAITVGEAEGMWKEDEAEMFHKVFEFRDHHVSEAMIPRTDIIWMEKGTTQAAFLAIFTEYPHLRFPVYEGTTTDNVVGIIFVKDVLKAQADHSITMESLIDDLIRPTFFVPETKHLGPLLSDMRARNYSVAMVVDEFGGISGMITVDKLIEEIVGEMSDELESEEERDIVAIDANTFELDGGLKLDEANDELGLNLIPGAYETVAGFVLSHLGRIPKKGEHLKYRDLKITILEMSGLKIERILVTREANAAPKS
jgi:putative hemolysin